MKSYKTSWVQRLIEGAWQKTFAFAHAKTVYTDYANKKTLADKLSEIDTSLDGKANSTHTHTKSQITDFPTLGTASAKDVASTGNASTTQVVMGNDTRLTDARQASDVSAWAKASVKPSYSKSEVGLGNVDNTSDTNKPVSTAQQTAIDTAYANANKYTDKKVADLIGSAPETMDTLEEVAAAIQENKNVETALNAAIGTKANQSELDTHTGNATIHITASERTKWNAAKTHADSTHARTDATKVEKSSTNGNIKINGTETTVYTHPSGTNPHGTTKSDVGLGNVGNFKAVSTVANQGLTDTEKSNARANIGAGISSFSGSYNDLTNKPTIPTNNNQLTNGAGYITSSGTAKTISDTLPISKGGTGKTNGADAANVLINSLEVGDTAPTDDTNIVVQGTGNYSNKFYRKPVSLLWNYIKSKLATVATSGSYNDLSNKPTIPSVGNGTVTIKQAGTSKGTFTMNQTGNTTIELTDNNTTYGVATQSANGLESAADKKKLDGIATGAEVNQNAFTNVVVGSTTISADSKTDSLTLAGSNVTLTPDATNDKVTIGITKANVTSALGYTPPTTNTTYGVATSSTPGLVKSGTDITVDSSGNVSVNDDSHNHVISNVDGLQNALDGKSVSKTLTNENLNNVTTPGFYNAGGGNTVTNKPSGIEHFGLIVIHRASGAYYTQIIFNDTSSYRRFCVNGTWGSWAQDKLTDTNTWRGIQNNLTSDSTTDSLSAAQGKVLKGLVDGKASSSHTHNYAGSSSAGGSATSAVKLDSSAGSATQPVYFSGGKPTACTYTLGKSVPSNAVFTDTNTWRPLGTTADTACAGNDSRLSNARPASDVYAWAKASSKPSYSWSEITSKPSSFTPASHTHDYLPLSGGTVTGETQFNNYLKLNAWSGYGTGTANFWYDANNKFVEIQNATDLKLSGTKVSKEGHTHNYLPLSGGTMNGPITFGKNDSFGIFTSTNNYCSIGSSSAYFYRAYINNIYLENLSFKNANANLNDNTRKSIFRSGFKDEIINGCAPNSSGIIDLGAKCTALNSTNGGGHHVVCCFMANPSESLVGRAVVYRGNGCNWYCRLTNATDDSPASGWSNVSIFVLYTNW